MGKGKTMWNGAHTFSCMVHPSSYPSLSLSPIHHHPKHDLDATSPPSVALMGFLPMHHFHSSPLPSLPPSLPIHDSSPVQRGAHARLAQNSGAGAGQRALLRAAALGSPLWRPLPPCQARALPDSALPAAPRLGPLRPARATAFRARVSSPPSPAALSAAPAGRPWFPAPSGARSVPWSRVGRGAESPSRSF